MQDSFALRRWRIHRTAALLIATASLQAQIPLFVQQTEIPVGNNPAALALGGFTHAAKQDVVVINRGSADLTVLRGLGNGFFQNLTTQPVGISPRAVAVGDFNRDGRLDAVVANFASNTVSVLLGNGNGTFREFFDISAHGPVSLAVEDFNGDGKLDLAIVETNSNTISIFLGTGAGTFVPFFQTTVAERPSWITVDDFNRDGKLDLAVTNSNSNSVSILLGVGNGTFRPPLEFAAGEIPVFVVSGDFNQDGIPDLAVADSTGFAASTVSILLGNGNGSFQAPLLYAVEGNASFLAVADFNLDGKLDLAVANTGSNTISILLGFGNGRFQPPLTFDACCGPAWIGVTDLNDDGKPDLVVANNTSNTVSVWMNRTSALGQSSVQVDSVVNAASFKAGAIAPGEIVTIFGSNLGPDPGVSLQFTASGLVATKLDRTQVFFDGVPAPLLYVSTGQINAIVPYAVGGANTQMIVETNGAQSSALTIPVIASAPALFTTDPGGTGQGAILNQDGSLNSTSHPAARGSVVTIYATGAGETNPGGIDGALAGGILPKPLLPVAVTMNGQPAQVVYKGAGPGLVAGVLQVNAQVPDNIDAGTASVRLQVGDAVSQDGVTLSVQ